MTRPSVRVLVVEDDPNVRRDVAEVLAEEGYLVEQAADGVAALERARVSWPDVILLDLYLPLMDGWTLLNTLRRLNPDRDTAVIVMTTDRYAQEEAQHLGARGCLPKPFELDELLGLLETITFSAP